MRLKLFAKKTLPFFVLLFLSVTLSCTHNLEIINLDTYKNKNLNRLDKNVTIGIIPNTNNPYSNKNNELNCYMNKGPGQKFNWW